MPILTLDDLISLANAAKSFITDCLLTTTATLIAELAPVCPRPGVALSG